MTRIDPRCRDTGEQFFAGVVDTGDKLSFANISANFQKIQNGPKRILMDGPGGH